MTAEDPPIAGNTIYVWQVYEGGGWGTIAATVIPDMGTTVLVARSITAAQRLRLFAEHHHNKTGLPVRLARFDDPTVIFEMR